ncbi:hypothetical protein [Botryobacter ruber]|uniref:hypothetical protein n=1 Tax=Botryobacter ruber TaxID=2171629 RepID=UPI000E0B043C|nr:hypothetical protein [Botryobacter ruber]
MNGFVPNPASLQGKDALPDLQSASLHSWYAGKQIANPQAPEFGSANPEQQVILSFCETKDLFNANPITHPYHCSYVCSTTSSILAFNKKRSDRFAASCSWALARLVFRKIGCIQEKPPAVILFGIAMDVR